MPDPWKKHSRKVLSEHRIFTLLCEHFESPRTGKDLDATIIVAPDWVNVIALTDDARCVLIKQYRFGTDCVTLEIPGGIIDPGETPVQAALRELREETGYASSRWTSLGSIAPNPAFERNRLHSYLAEGCVRVGDQQQDAGEDIEVVLVDESDIDGLLARGALDHALVVFAFQKLALLRRGFPVL
ncbi:MAG TPA: NUDIX hydrolase [Polyangiales bacterium]